MLTRLWTTSFSFSQCCLPGHLPDPCLLPGTQVSPSDLDKEKGWQGAGVGQMFWAERGLPIAAE